MIFIKSDLVPKSTTYILSHMGADFEIVESFNMEGKYVKVKSAYGDFAGDPFYVQEADFASMDEAIEYINNELAGA
jgi:hypothetical protein